MVVVKRNCAKAASFQTITEAEKSFQMTTEADKQKLGQRRETDVKQSIKIKLDKGRRKRRRKRKGKQKKKKKQRKNKRKSGENKPKKRKITPLKNSPVNMEEKESNLRRSKPTDTQSRSHKQNLLQHVLDIEERTRGRNVDRIEENLSVDASSSSENDNNTTATQLEKTQDNPVSSNKVEKEKKQKPKKKKRKKKKKCKYTKRDLKAKNEKTCNRAKERAKLSYKTMDLLFEQIFDESLIFSKVIKREKKHSRFFAAAKAFVSNNTVCDGNPTWNSVLLDEKLNEFKENIDELAQCFLGQKLTNDRNSETFDENTVGLSKSDREGFQNCMETQNKTERCAHCNKKCGEALKNGEICVQRAVRLLEKARRSRENCQSQFRKLDKMQQRLVHDMYG